MTSQTRRGRPRSTPDYFRKTSFHRWDIISFLQATFRHLEKQGKAHRYIHSKASSMWLGSLKHIQNTGSKEWAGMAKSLHGKWESRDRERALEWVKGLGYNWAVPRNITSSVVYNCAAIGSANTNINNNNINANPILDEGEEFNGINSGLSDEPNMDSDNDIDTETDTHENLHDSTDDDDYQLPMQDQSFTFKTTRRSLKTIIAGSNLPRDHLAREGVLDIGSSKVVELLGLQECELDELKNLVPRTPELDQHFVRSLDRFSNVEPDTFRQVIETVPYRDVGVAYQRGVHSDAEWVTQVFLHMIRLYERHADLKTIVSKEAKEGWLDTNIWSTLIDSCVVGHDGLFLQRKEVKSSSLHWRSKEERVESSNATSNSRLDGLLYTLDNPRLEFGAVEVSTSYKDTGAPKWLSDTNKLLTTLHTMAMHTSELVKADETTMRAVQFVAFIHAGLKFKIYRLFMISPTQSLCVAGELRSIPSTLQDIHEIFACLNSIHLAVKVLNQSANIVKTYLRKRNRFAPGGDLKQLLGSSGF